VNLPAIVSYSRICNILFVTLRPASREARVNVALGLEKVENPWSRLFVIREVDIPNLVYNTCDPEFVSCFCLSRRVHSNG
jgi:hypothetical protein